ncbi:MAG TPA: hypothetical protein VM694_09810 [Polyangium sp.]|nr:hypothetical protein [Polyangium sp.]
MQAHASYVDALAGDAPSEPQEVTPPNPPEEARVAPQMPADEGAPSFAKSLLGDGPEGAAGAMRDDARRFATALVLSALYGLSIGTRDGGLSILKHAAAVPLAPLAVAGLGVPALFIVLTLFDAPIDPPAAVKAAARGAATTGLVLGGLAPAMALFVTTSSSRIGAAFSAGLGLILAGAFGLRAFLGAIGTPLGRASAGVRTMSGFALAGFTIFATALSARVWWSTLPIFGGAP